MKDLPFPQLIPRASKTIFIPIPLVDHYQLLASELLVAAFLTSRVLSSNIFHTAYSSPSPSHYFIYFTTADMRTLRLPSEIAYRAPYKTSRRPISPYQLTTPKARLTSSQYRKRRALGRRRRRVCGPLWAYSIQSLTSRRSPISRSVHAVVTRSIKYPIPDLNPASYRHRPQSRRRITTLSVVIATTSM